MDLFSRSKFRPVRTKNSGYIPSITNPNSGRTFQIFIGNWKALSLFVWHFGDVPTIDISAEEISAHSHFGALSTAYWRSNMIELGQENDRG
jgi:hypothetical protein